MIPICVTSLQVAQLRSAVASFRSAPLTYLCSRSTLVSLNYQVLLETGAPQLSRQVCCAFASIKVEFQ